MYVKKRMSLLLFAALAMVLFTACGRWDFSREAAKAANEAQGETLRVEFTVEQKFTNALRAALEENIQPADVEKAMRADESIKPFLTSGYRLDVYALRADVDADKAAAQLADEFASRLAGCEDEGFISMVKADNGYFYMAVLTYKHGGNGGSGSGSGGGSGSGDEGGGEEPEEPAWVTYADVGGLKTLTFLTGAGEHIGPDLGTNDEEKITEALKARGEWNGSDKFNLKEDVKSLVIKEGSGITCIGGRAFTGGILGKNTQLCAIDLSSEVKEIGEQAFYNCTVLTTVKMPGVTQVGYSAFGNAGIIGDLTLGSQSTNDNITIKGTAFSGCNLDTLTITTNGDLTISSAAFINCLSLKEVTLSAQNIVLKGGFNNGVIANTPYGAFENCMSLNSVKLNGNPKEIDENTFELYENKEDNLFGLDGVITNSTVIIKCTGGLEVFVKACPGGANITLDDADKITEVLNKVGIDNAEQIQQL